MPPRVCHRRRLARRYPDWQTRAGWMSFAKSRDWSVPRRLQATGGKTRPCVQQRARRQGNPGIHGNPGNLESVTYRIYEILSGSNPTLSANSLTHVGRWRLGRAYRASRDSLSAHRDLARIPPSPPRLDPLFSIASKSLNIWSLSFQRERCFSIHAGDDPGVRRRRPIGGAPATVSS